ncbi:hypothetical protein Droror1_Dr00010511 [Drosera rotundifolia]
MGNGFPDPSSDFSVSIFLISPPQNSPNPSSFPGFSWGQAMGVLESDVGSKVVLFVAVGVRIRDEVLLLLVDLFDFDWCLWRSAGSNLEELGDRI